MTGRERVLDRIATVQRLYGSDTGEADGLLCALAGPTIPPWIVPVLATAPRYARAFRQGFEDGRTILDVVPPEVAA